MTIVAIGASAGGFEAFAQVLAALPPDLGMAYVFVQHLAPKHESALPALLAEHTAMPVAQVSEGVQIEANHVYVIPPDKRLVMSGDRLHLTPRPDNRSQYTPIDAFFTSVAEAAGSRAVGIVLSGSASDGALGIREIKAADGITLVQSPETAKYDSMPRAAVATGAADLVLSTAEIAAKLAEIARHPYARIPQQNRGDELSVRPDQLLKIFELLRPVSGVDFRHYKLPTIKRRLFRRMALNRIHDISHYVRLLQESSDEGRLLYQDLLINVTRFFRDNEAFVALRAHVFPKLIANRGHDQPIRVWVSGCSTGEEAYSLAIELVEYLQEQNKDIRIQIFATDVSENAIEHARAGVYSASIEADVSPERLQRFFAKSDDHYRISKTIRDLAVFARQDLTRDPPFSKLDLVLCRNVLIYMDAVLQNKLISVFHYALKADGYLVLGQAETVGQAGLFTIVENKARLHKKKTTAPAPPLGFPVDSSLAGTQHRRVAPEGLAAEKALQAEVSRALLDRYAPSGVVVDDGLQVVQFRGQTGAFLEPAPGEASLHLLKLAREGLLYGLRTALQTARKKRESVRKEGLHVKSDEGWRMVDLEVVPLTSGGGTHFLVLFEEPAARKAKAAKGTAKGKGGRAKATSVAERRSKLELLQRELNASREYLQSIIQELEAANEELQSANEEILSSNEELQSTNEELDTAKEELQSTNEELNTVNEELHGRNEELSRANSDLINLIGSVQIAIVIVARDLRIRRFTPMAERVLNLIPSDVDRSIAHINPNIDCPNLAQLIQDCIEQVAPSEQEVLDRQGRRFALRIRPYQNIDNKIDGAVVTLFDIEGQRTGTPA